MKIGFISDIHGNYEALIRVLQELDRMDVNEIYSLGDVGGYYSQINECCNELRRRRIPNLMGNHDWYLAGGGFCPRAESVNHCLDYQRSVITYENLNWLRSSKIQLNIAGIKMVHGGWSDPIDEYIRNPNKDYFSKIEGNTFVSGHTHVQSIYRFKDKVYCNPGSVGQPRDGNTKAAFATYIDNEFELHRVTYDIERVCQLMSDAGFSERYYRRLRKGI